MTTTLPRPTTEAPAGVTPREWLAALAMQGLLAAGVEGKRNVATLARQHADALMRELDETEAR